MPREALRKKRERTIDLIGQLKQDFPDAQCSLFYKTNFQLLIATMLSAQTTDLAVNKVTPSLFRSFGTAQKMAAAPQEVLEEHLKTIGLFRSKAKNIKKTAQILWENYQGKVPKNQEELVLLPGVGRKTANVVLGNAFHIPAMVVDTHVTRIAYRLGLTQEATPDKIEKDLEKVVPEEEWVLFTHLIIEHGRAICTARRPKCETCSILHYCPQKERKR